MKTLYVLNYWVDFPSSKYGGLVVVVASNDAECESLIRESFDIKTWWEGNLKSEIKGAQRFQVSLDTTSEVVAGFTT